MTGPMRSLGIIHARGGSRRIPRKNVKPLLGTPLIGWLAAAAVESRLTRVVVSTDDDEIADIARRFGVDAPFRRPGPLAEDVPSEMVTRHAVDWFERERGERFDVAVTLQPTTPFVEPSDIDRCLDALGDPAAQSSLTVKRASQPPEWLLIQEESGLARPFLDGAMRGERGVAQSLPSYYIPNGAAYATRVAALLTQDAILAMPLKIVVMSDERSVDLDEPIDWQIAETIGRSHAFQPFTKDSVA